MAAFLSFEEHFQSEVPLQMSKINTKPKCVSIWCSRWNSSTMGSVRSGHWFWSLQSPQESGQQYLVPQSIGFLHTNSCWFFPHVSNELAETSAAHNEWDWDSEVLLVKLKLETRASSCTILLCYCQTHKEVELFVRGCHPLAQPYCTCGACSILLLHSHAGLALNKTF